MMEEVEKALKRYWGYDQFRPLQKQAIECVLAGRDSVVVMPTGGGKSLCFQAPALVMPGLAVVVSPLISLMKDQVDALSECGVAAARLDSTQSAFERNEVMNRIRAKSLRILYLAPERLFTSGFMDLLAQANLSFIAVDEAHCISVWGHDFRPEYRQLGALKEVFPLAAVHAYTATATEQVRRDIAQQLNLKNPQMLVGSFDRPNLIYRVEEREKGDGQIRGVLDRHKGESGIIYCIRRADVDQTCARLSAKGYRVAPYHAGMENEDRKRNQDAFSTDKVDIIVATVAFGMGIDKSNVRFVIHAGMPKSLEHYHQESGRAGRDGLEAECCLFYARKDYMTWKFIVGGGDPEATRVALRKLQAMFRFCINFTCRHQAILKYFGERAAQAHCGACDVCLGDEDGDYGYRGKDKEKRIPRDDAGTSRDEKWEEAWGGESRERAPKIPVRSENVTDSDIMPDSLVIAQKILSSVVRLGNDATHRVTVWTLVGSRRPHIMEQGYDQLSTYGILLGVRRRYVHGWIGQLVAQGYLESSVGDQGILRVTEKGWQVLKGNETPRLARPERRRKKSRGDGEKPAPPDDPWEGVDRDLFEILRAARRAIADEKKVPAFIVFSDASLRDMARRRPATPEEFLEITGVGETKRRQYGERFLVAIREYGKA